MRVRRNQTVSTLCIAAMLAVCAGCGSSSSSNSSSAATAASSATSTATTTATSSSGGGGGSASDAAFCGEAKATAQNLEKVDAQIAAVGTPTAFKTLLNNDMSAYSKLVADAPSDISADAQTLETSFNKVIAFFTKYHYDIQQAAPHIGELNGLINSPKVKAAQAHLKAWGDSNCS
jgi:ABC-type phosphate transport system substrate-binding protein